MGAEFFNPKELANPGKIFLTPCTCKEAAQAGQIEKKFNNLAVF
jgi:glycolate oxidase